MINLISTEQMEIFNKKAHIRLMKINEYTSNLKFVESGYPGNAHSLHLPPTKYGTREK